MALGGMVWNEGDRWFAVLASDEGVVKLNWSCDRAEMEKKIQGYTDVPFGAAVRRNLEKVRREVHEYFTGQRKKFTIPIAAESSDFEKKVWSALSKIPFGKTMTYGELAAQIGAPKAARAVGQAAGRNPVPLIIPCHRLLAEKGKLGGFSGGIDEKKRLLEHEGIKWVE